MHDPFPFPCQGRNVNYQDFSFQTFKKTLHLQKLVFIIVHQNQIIDVNDNEKFDIFDLCNIPVKVHITPHKLNVFKENI